MPSGQRIFVESVGTSVGLVWAWEGSCSRKRTGDKSQSGWSERKKEKNQKRPRMTKEACLKIRQRERQPVRQNQTGRASCKETGVADGRKTLSSWPSWKGDPENRSVTA